MPIKSHLRKLKSKLQFKVKSYTQNNITNQSRSATLSPGGFWRALENLSAGANASARATGITPARTAAAESAESATNRETAALGTETRSPAERGDLAPLGWAARRDCPRGGHARAPRNATPERDETQMSAASTELGA